MAESKSMGSYFLSEDALSKLFFDKSAGENRKFREHLKRCMDCIQDLTNQKNESNEQIKTLKAALGKASNSMKIKTIRNGQLKKKDRKSKEQVAEITAIKDQLKNALEESQKHGKALVRALDEIKKAKLGLHERLKDAGDSNENLERFVEFLTDEVTWLSKDNEVKPPELSSCETQTCAPFTSQVEVDKLRSDLDNVTSSCAAATTKVAQLKLFLSSSDDQMMAMEEELEDAKTSCASATSEVIILKTVLDQKTAIEDELRHFKASCAAATTEVGNLKKLVSCAEDQKMAIKDELDRKTSSCAAAMTEVQKLKTSSEFAEESRKSQIEEVEALKAELLAAKNEINKAADEKVELERANAAVNRRLKITSLEAKMAANEKENAISDLQEQLEILHVENAILTKKSKKKGVFARLRQTFRRVCCCCCRR